MAVGILIVFLSVDSILSLVGVSEVLLWFVRLGGLIVTMGLITVALFRARSKVRAEEAEADRAERVSVGLDRSATAPD